MAHRNTFLHIVQTNCSSTGLMNKFFCMPSTSINDGGGETLGIGLKLTLPGIEAVLLRKGSKDEVLVAIV